MASALRPCIPSPAAPPAARGAVGRRSRCAQTLCVALAVLLMTDERRAPAAANAADAPSADRQIVGDAIPQSLTGSPGNAVRGRRLAFARDRGNCIACHAIPAPDEASHGNLGPSLRGVADRLNEGQIRLRLVDIRRIAPATIMPAYYRVDGRKRVAAALAGKPVLAAQEIEDVVAFLMALHEHDKR
jgi:L-cysteine S-thiosulfotransferase